MLDLDYNQYKNFWDLCRSFNHIIHTEIEKDDAIFNLFKITKLNPSLLDSTYYQKYGIIDNKWSSLLLKGMGVNDLIADLSITNIGKLNFPVKFGDLNLRAIYGPSVYSDLLNCIVGVVTINNKMNLIITFNEKIISIDTVERIKEIFMNILERYCDW